MRSNRVRRTTKGPSIADGLFDWRKKTPPRLGAGDVPSGPGALVGRATVGRDADETLIESLDEQETGENDVDAEHVAKVLDGGGAELLERREHDGDQEGDPAGTGS